MDFFVSILTESKLVYISTQNAYSWGYCDENEKWLINADFQKFFANLILIY